MSFLGLKCSCAKKDEKEIQGICVNQSCDKSRPACIICLMEHSSHFSEILDFNQFAKWKKEGLAINELIQNVAEELQHVLSILTELMKMNNTNAIQELDLLKTEEVNTLVAHILKLKSLESLLFKDLTQLNGQLQQVRAICKNIETFKGIEDQTWVIESQQPGHNFQSQQPDTQMIQQQIREAINPMKVLTKYQFRFSQQEKHKNIRVSEYGDIVKTQLEYFQQGYAYCFCEPALQKFGVIRLAFRIIKCGYVAIGMCRRDLIRQTNYYVGLQNIGNGSYLINQNGYIYSHHQKQLNFQQESFKFSTNDIIVMKVNMDMKKITWKRQKSFDQYTMPFVLQEDLYLCVGLQQSEVEIMQGI